MIKECHTVKFYVPVHLYILLCGSNHDIMNIIAALIRTSSVKQNISLGGTRNNNDCQTC